MAKTATSQTAEQRKVDARAHALMLAHDREIQPEEVVRRAKAYLAFMEE